MFSVLLQVFFVIVDFFKKGVKSVGTGFFIHNSLKAK